MASASALFLAFAMAGLTAAPAAAVERCLSAKERRAAIAKKEALPLPRAVHDVRSQLGGEIVRARLCEGETGLVYLLTVLAQNGKVTRAAVDALNGRRLDLP